MRNENQTLNQIFTNQRMAPGHQRGLCVCGVRLMAANGFGPQGNSTDISYLREKSELPQKRDICNLYAKGVSL